MNQAYQDTLTFIFEKLPMFSRVGAAAYKPNLNNIKLLCERIGNPHLKFKSIHVGGTNGKGSSSHMLAAVMQENGYRTGLYTSPHIEDFRERIRINGDMISTLFVIDFVAQIKPLIEELNPSFFEITVAMAFDYFAKEQVDIAIVEVGLGGLLDSTNIIQPEVSLITNISLDHTNLLGSTLQEIASQKAGIIKEFTPIVISETQGGVEQVFFSTSIIQKSPIFFADQQYQLIKKNWLDGLFHLSYLKLDELKIVDLKTDLQGEYQIQNVRGVLVVLDVLKSLGWKLDEAITLNALGQINQLTGLKGRFEILHQNPRVILDVSHNKAGLQHVFKQIAQLKFRKLHVVMGFVKDKELDVVLDIFPKDAIYYVTQAQIERALSFNDLGKLCTERGLSCQPCEFVSTAIESAWDASNPEDVILVTGSFFIMDEAYTCLNNLLK